jgi:hypothetical protein
LRTQKEEEMKLQRPATVLDHPTRPVREMMIAMGLKSEILYGMRMTAKAPPCNSIVAKEYGCKGSKVKRYMQFCEMTDQKPDPKIAELWLKEKK